MVARVAMNGMIPILVMTMPLMSPTVRPAATPPSEPGRPVVGRQQRRHHARHRRRAADREVDAAGHDDQRHAERDQGEHGVVAQEGQRIELRQEIVVAQRAEHDQRNQRRDDAQAREVDVGPQRQRPEQTQFRHARSIHPRYPCSERCWMNTASTMSPALTMSAAASGTPLASRV